jgi:plastocyanin
MRNLIVPVALAVGAAAWACGSTSSTPTTPTPTGGGGAAGSTISIVANRGAQSFAPNPATVVQSSTVAFQNNDSVTHHIVMNDGTFDSGNIPPGGSSAALTLATDGGNYHCTIHPTMVGSMKSSSGTVPPCSGVYCDSSR